MKEPAPIYANSVVEMGAKRFRLLDFIPTKSDVSKEPRWAAYQLNTANAVPVVWPKSELKRWLDLDTAKVVADEPWPTPAQPYDSDIAIRDKRWARIKDLVRPERDGLYFGRTHELYAKKARNRLLEEHSEYLGGVTAKTLLADLRRYWERGMTPDALLGDYWMCGRVNEATSDADVVEVEGDMGRKYAYFAPANGASRGCKPGPNQLYTEPFHMTAAVRKQILKIAKKLFMKDERVSMRSVADDVTLKMFARRDSEGKLLRGNDGEAVLVPPGKRPSTEQVRYLLRKTVGSSSAYKARVGEANFNNNHSAAAGSVHDDCMGPGDVYEIDATFVDVYLVAEDDTTCIIGKATLYLVIDRDTNLIVGFYMSLEPPKFEEAKQAVLSICGDWEGLCERLGVEYYPQAWPAVGVFPNRWVGDRGELLCYGSDILGLNIGEDVTNLPARAARKKCRVEGGFHTTSVVLKDSADGYSFPRNAKKRQGKKYERDACLTLENLVRIYLILVQAHNLKAANPKVLKPGIVYGNGQGKRKLPTPAQLWNDGVETMGGLAVHAYETVRRALMLRADGVVRQDGIEFCNLRYELEDKVGKDWLATASLRGQFDVTVAYSPSLVDTLLVYHSSDPSKAYPARLTPLYSTYFSGRAFAEVKAHVAKHGELLPIIVEQRTANRLGTREGVEAISKPAHAEMKDATSGMTLGERVNKGKEQRPKELINRRKKIHDVTKTPEAHAFGILEGGPQADANSAEAPSAGQPADAAGTALAKQSSSVPAPGAASSPSTVSVRDEPSMLDDLEALLGA